MAVNKKRDFKRLSLCIQDFLKRLPCNETTGFLRDTLYLSLLELHKYYIKQKAKLNSCIQQETLAVVEQNPCKDVELDKYDEQWKVCDDSGRFRTAVEGNVKDNVLSDDHDMLGRSYLMHAIHLECQQEIIEYILSLNFNTNHQAQDGSTALHVACQHQKIKIAALLLKNKASISIKDKKGCSALHWAAKCQSSDMVKLLLQYGADINAKDCDGMTPAMWASYFDKPDNLNIIQNALERIDPRSDAILDEQDNMGRTVLHWAALMSDQTNSMACLKELLTLGNVCKVKDNEGRTVLHTAATQGSVSACKQILSSGDKDMINMKDNQDQTALHLATLSGHGEMVDFLLQNGASNLVCNKNARTPLQEAEIGHYHYCLLVFAAFEQMQDKKETEAPLNTAQREVEKEVEKKNKDQKRYESWVIPSTSLNESHNIPTDAGSELVRQQHVDVMEIKGFEISSELEDQMLTNISVAENKTTQKDGKNNPDLNSKKLVQKNNPTTTKTKPALTNNKPLVIKSDKTVPATDGRKSFTSKNNKNALLQRSERVDEAQEINKQEETNVHNDKSTTKSPSASEDLEGSENLEQNNSEDESEISDVSSLNIGEDDSQEQDEETNKDSISPDVKQTSRKIASAEPNRGLTPLKPLPQPSFNFPAKLDPILLPHSSKKLQSFGNVQPRGIVAPLEPAVQKEQSGLSLLSREKEQHPSAGSNYAIRAPDHGPLAQAHSKELLNSVFKEHVNKNVQQQKTPEIQRRSMPAAKLSRATVRH